MASSGDPAGVRHVALGTGTIREFGEGESEGVCLIRLGAALGLRNRF